MMNKTTTIRNILVMVVFLTIVVSCGGEKAILRADMNLALRLSGENRHELEKVLKHYSIDKKDTLKQCFSEMSAKPEETNRCTTI